MQPANSEQPRTGARALIAIPPPLDRERRQVLDYFKTARPERFRPEEFQNYWRAATRISWNGEDLALIVHNAARMSHKAPESREISALIARGLGKFENQILPSRFIRDDVANIMWSFAKTGLVPEAATVAHLEEQWNADKAGGKRFPAVIESSCLAWAYSALALQPGPDVAESWRADIGGDMQTLPAAQLAPILWSLSVQSTLTGDDSWRPLAERMRNCIEKRFEKAPAAAFADKTVKQYRDACHYFGWPPKITATAESGCHSDDEIRIKHKLAQAGLSVQDGFHIASLNHAPDIALKTRGRLCLVEYDGPTHFNRSANGTLLYDGHTLLQSALIRSHAPNAMLLRFRHAEDHVVSKDARTLARLVDLLNKACQHPPTAMETCLKNGQLDLRPHAPAPARL